MKKHKNSGFTLLELLIVIAIIAILSVALVIVINPGETLKKSRDAQRISDLSTLKTAIGLYMTSTTTPALDGVYGASANNTCKPTPSTAMGSGGLYKIWYSYPTSAGTISDVTIDGSTAATPKVQRADAATASLVDGTGWIPVNMATLTGGSPISNYPMDPINTIGDVANVASGDLVYRYECSKSPLAYEIDAQLESTAYTVTENKLTSDGGNNATMYETGTNLLIIGAGVDF
jgi:prepilin-type N-terminal cleavage/methylation domain-containing protein